MLSRYRGALYRALANPALVSVVESDALHGMDYDEVIRFYLAIAPHMTLDDKAYLGAVDRFYLVSHIMGRTDVLHPWLYERCREVELEPDGFLDLWAREHYKSTLITFAGSVQEIINDPEITIGIFSHTKDIATKFVRQIKGELEKPIMRELYPDLVWINPAGEAPKWSDSQIVVRRKGNPKECTVEAWGLVDGQPTGAHFGLLVYDDVVTPKSVTTPEMVVKTTEAWELSDNLGAGDRRKWMAGTRYSFGDTYGDLMGRDGVVKVRLYPATHNGRLDGKPVFLSATRWEKIKRTQKSTVAAQMLQNPLSGKEQVFLPGWFTGFTRRPSVLNVYIMADPSRGRTSSSDRTAIAVVGIDTTGNKYLLDGFCHRMKLSERWDALKHLHKKWSSMPGVQIVRVGYERFGQQSDDEYFAERMQAEGYTFGIDELAWPREGGNSKRDRVERLQPDFEYGAFFVPSLVSIRGVTHLWKVEEDHLSYHELKGELSTHKALKASGQEYLAQKPIVRRNEANEAYDLTRELLSEMMFFPFASHDDLVDATSRIYDMDARPAEPLQELDEKVFEDA